MEIRKLFNVEAAQHVVRNATSYRCSHSVHNHGAVVEVFLTSDKLDNGGMVVDFGILKGTVKSFIDSFDHCMTFWEKDNVDYIQDMKKWNDRWIVLPINPTAELLSVYMCYIINKIIDATEFNNGEGHVKCSRVIYHETVTGYAEGRIEDTPMLSPIVWRTDFSEGVYKNWPIELRRFFADRMPSGVKYFKNPIIEQQV